LGQGLQAAGVRRRVGRGGHLGNLARLLEEGHCPVGAAEFPVEPAQLGQAGGVAGSALPPGLGAPPPGPHAGRPTAGGTGEGRAGSRYRLAAATAAAAVKSASSVRDSRAASNPDSSSRRSAWGKSPLS